MKVVQELLEQHKHLESAMTAENVADTTSSQPMDELRKLFASLGPAEIAAILDQLSPEQLLLAWGAIDDLLQDEILHEVLDSTRDALAARSSYLSSDCVVNAFELFKGRLTQTTIESAEDLAGIKPLWVDLVGTTKADRLKIGDYFGLDLPDPEDLTDIEASARFYVEDGSEIHLHSDFLLDREGDSRNVPVAFILYKEILFSVREEELPVFRLQRLRARTQTGYVSDGMDLLLDLYAADAEYSADALEDVYAALGRVGKKVLSETMTDSEAAETLADIAEEEDLNGRIRRNGLDTRRALAFLVRRKLLSAIQLEDAQQIMRDIESLDGHTAFLFEKINFLMDATVGFVNINQNRVIYRLTVLSVIFMPLNVIAGIGGMSEFSMMTQNIPWPLSYAIFTLAMFGVAWLTYIILRYYEKPKKVRRLS